MPNLNVYDPDSFAARVNFAAAVIGRHGPNSRRLDSCFEMYDGAAVSASLVRRAKANPGGPLALNLFGYITEDRALQHYEDTKSLSHHGLSRYAANLRDVAQKAFKASLAASTAQSFEENKAAAQGTV